MQRVERSIRVSAPVSKAYDYWRDFQNFPRFMEHVEEVRLLDGERHRQRFKDIVEGRVGSGLSRQRRSEKGRV